MKSFSRHTKAELLKVKIHECCAKAELLAFLLFGASLSPEKIKFSTENESLALKAQELFKAVFNIAPPINQAGQTFIIAPENPTAAENVLLYFKLSSAENKKLVTRRPNGYFLKRECCKKAFVRGAFLSSGTITPPNKSYHFEIHTPYFNLSRDMLALLEGIDIPCKVSMRKSSYVIYAKDSELISDILAFMGGYSAQMELLNAKIEKELRSAVNRTVNCETANMEKAVSAALRQIQAIEIIDGVLGLKNISPELQEIAAIRKENPDLSTTELGRLLEPPLTKSGVNHRLRRLTQIAEEI